MKAAPNDADLADLVKELSVKLLDQGLVMAAAESCTGGWIAKCCTDMAGSSAWFERGFVVYSYAAKREMLDVDSMILETGGSVSEAAAVQMAAGAVRESEADVSVAVTGIAGPAGGTRAKPVGLVWFAWSVGRTVSTERMIFRGGRDEVRRLTVAHALKGLAGRL